MSRLHRFLAFGMMVMLLVVLSGCTRPPVENDTPPDIFQPYENQL